jgi:hypothetical protein
VLRSRGAAGAGEIQVFSARRYRWFDLEVGMFLLVVMFL